MSDDVGQLQQLRRVRVNERHRCERELQAAAEHHRCAAETLNSLEQAIASSAAKRARAVHARVRQPGDPVIENYCRTMEAGVAELQRKLEQARLRLDETVQALTAARKHRMRAELWLQAIENRLREARMRERKRRERLHQDEAHCAPALALSGGSL